MLSASELPRAESEVATPSALLAALPMPRSSSEIVSPTAEFLPLVQLSDFGADRRRSGPTPAPASRASQAEPALASTPSPDPPPRVHPIPTLAEQSTSCQAQTMPARAAVTECHGQQGVSTHGMLRFMHGQSTTVERASNPAPPSKDDSAKTTLTAPVSLNSRPALQRNALLVANATAATTEQKVTGRSMSSHRPSARDHTQFATVPPAVQEQKQGVCVASLRAPSQVFSLGQALTASSHSARLMGNSSDVVVFSRLPGAASAPRLQTLGGSPRPAERMLHTSFVGHPISGCHLSPATSRSCSYSVPQPCTNSHLNTPSPPHSPQPRPMAQRSVDARSSCSKLGNLSMRAASSPSSAVPAAAGRTSCRTLPIASRPEPFLSPSRPGAGTARVLQSQALQQTGCAMPWRQSCTIAPAVSHGAHTCATSLHRSVPAVATMGQPPRPAGVLTGPVGPKMRCVTPSASAVPKVLPTFAASDRSLRQPALHSAIYAAGGLGSPPVDAQHYLIRTRK
mmetsp:Transcript_124011/g.246941  ORF Transcript_124011/g.246941 Transcript_124011/m.246941 type:complete len:511 (-) Transcript_124011:130-1662(-)